MVQIVGGDLETEGYLHLRDCIDPSLVTPELIRHIEATANNPAEGTGAIVRPQHTKETREIERQTIAAIRDAAPGLDLHTRPRTTDPVQLAPGQPLIAIRVGPPPCPGAGGLGWHVDAFSYYLRAEHSNWYVCYTPILKEQPSQSNLAIIPYSVLRELHPELYHFCKGRGAINVDQVRPEDVEWARRVFPDDANPVQAGDWYAKDIYDDDSYGVRLKFDIEQHRVVPQLEKNDVLVFRADVIHRTEDTDCLRISIKSDLVPRAPPGPLPSLSYVWWWYFTHYKVAKMVVGMRRRYWPYRMALVWRLVQLRFCLRDVKSIDDIRGAITRGG